MTEINLTPEMELRLAKVRARMSADGAQAVLLADSSNIYYISGRVFRGYIYITLEGEPLFFVIRPNDLRGSCVHQLRKPELIPEILSSHGLPMPSSIALEIDDLPYSEILRLNNIFGGATPLNASAMLREARAVKTAAELSLMKEDGVRQAAAYSRIPRIYKEDMTDIEFQIELERVLRLEGCLGYYRTSGRLMEINMGSVLNGENADAPTPYDFAVGGGGADLSLPVGADGRTMKPGTTVMVDMCGNFNGYQTDMTRVWSIGPVSELALRAHEVSRKVLRTLEREALPSVPVAKLYEIAMDIVVANGLEKYFMGHTQHAAFIGHGVGIQLNELPVLTPRSRHLLEADMVIAIEPKFVIPEVGAVGVENTYRVTPSGLECLTNFPEEIHDLLQ